MKDNIKILILGDEGVGKTSLLSTFLSCHFPPEVPPELITITLPSMVSSNNVSITLLDSSNYNFKDNGENGEGFDEKERHRRKEEEYRKKGGIPSSGKDEGNKILREKIKQCDSILLLYDITNKTSLINITKKWLPLIKEIHSNIDIIRDDRDDNREDLDDNEDLEEEIDDNFEDINDIRKRRRSRSHGGSIGNEIDREDERERSDDKDKRRNRKNHFKYIPIIIIGTKIDLIQNFSNEIEFYSDGIGPSLSSLTAAASAAVSTSTSAPIPGSTNLPPLSTSNSSSITPPNITVGSSNAGSFPFFNERKREEGERDNNTSLSLFAPSINTSNNNDSFFTSNTIIEDEDDFLHVTSTSTAAAAAASVSSSSTSAPAPTSSVTSSLPSSLSSFYYENLNFFHLISSSYPYIIKYFFISSKNFSNINKIIYLLELYTIYYNEKLFHDFLIYYSLLTSPSSTLSSSLTSSLSLSSSTSAALSFFSAAASAVTASASATLPPITPSVSLFASSDTALKVALEAKKLSISSSPSFSSSSSLLSSLILSNFYYKTFLRIFRIFDKDCDGLLNDEEMYDSQLKCFDIAITYEELYLIKRTIRERENLDEASAASTSITASGMMDISPTASPFPSSSNSIPVSSTSFSAPPSLLQNKITFNGFLNLMKLLMENNEFQDIYAILTRYNYSSKNLKLILPYELKKILYYENNIKQYYEKTSLNLYKFSLFKLSPKTISSSPPVSISTSDSNIASNTGISSTTLPITSTSSPLTSSIHLELLSKVPELSPSVKFFLKSLARNCSYASSNGSLYLFSPSAFSSSSSSASPLPSSNSEENEEEEMISEETLRLIFSVLPEGRTHPWMNPPHFKLNSSSYLSIYFPIQSSSTSPSTSLTSSTLSTPSLSSSLTPSTSPSQLLLINSPHTLSSCLSSFSSSSSTLTLSKWLSQWNLLTIVDPREAQELLYLLGYVEHEEVYKQIQYNHTLSHLYKDFLSFYRLKIKFNKNKYEKKFFSFKNLKGNFGNHLSLTEENEEEERDYSLNMFSKIKEIETYSNNKLYNNYVKFIINKLFHKKNSNSAVISSSTSSSNSLSSLSFFKSSPPPLPRNVLKVAILGNNFIGKTTLLKNLGGFSSSSSYSSSSPPSIVSTCLEKKLSLPDDLINEIKRFICKNGKDPSFSSLPSSITSSSSLNFPHYLSSTYDIILSSIPPEYTSEWIQRDVHSYDLAILMTQCADLESLDYILTLSQQLPANLPRFFLLNKVDILDLYRPLDDSATSTVATSANSPVPSTSLSPIGYNTYLSSTSTSSSLRPQTYDSHIQNCPLNTRNLPHFSYKTLYKQHEIVLEKLEKYIDDNNLPSLLTVSLSSPSSFTLSSFFSSTPTSNSSSITSSRLSSTFFNSSLTLHKDEDILNMIQFLLLAPYQGIPLKLREENNESHNKKLIVLSLSLFTFLAYQYSFSSLSTLSFSSSLFTSLSSSLSSSFSSLSSSLSSTLSSTFSTLTSFSSSLSTSLSSSLSKIKNSLNLSKDSIGN